MFRLGILVLTLAATTPPPSRLAVIAQAPRTVLVDAAGNSIRARNNSWG